MTKPLLPGLCEIFLYSLDSALKILSCSGFEENFFDAQITGLSNNH
jgi:hypothetical protein